MEKVTHSTLYIELDCLFDTRFGVLFGMGPTAVECIRTGEYFDRLLDEFIGVDMKDFRRRYSKRDKSVLKFSVVTPLLTMITEFVTETFRQHSTSPYTELPKVVINSYPYVLTHSEAALIIGQVVSATNKRCDVEMVHLAINELTPSYVKEQYSIMVMYDYPKWIEHHSQTGDFKKVTCPELTLMGPAIFFNGMPSRASLDKAKSIDMTPFKAMEMVAGPLVNLKLLSIDHFSLKAQKSGSTP